MQESRELRKMPTAQQLAELRFGHGDIDFSRVHIGDKMWKTSDPELEKRLRQSFAGDAPKFQRPIEIEVHGLAGKPLTLIARDEFGNVAKVESAMPLAKAEKLPLTEEKLREQLGRLGGTPFRLGELKNFLTGEVLLPVSELNRLRREIVVELEKLRAQPKRWTLNVGQASRLPGERPAQALNLLMLPPDSVSRGRRDACPTLIVLVRNLPQLEAALKCGVKTVYCEFEDPKKYREAVTTFHNAFGCEGGGQSSARRRHARSDAPHHFRRSSAHFQNGRGMDARTGPLLQRRRLPGPQLRSPEIFRQRPARGRLLAEHRQPDFRGLFQKPIRPGARDGELRPEFFAARSAAARRAAGMVRGDDSPAHADVSHGALRVLRVSFQRQGLPRLRAALRPARRAAARPRRRGASAQGGRRLPQHRVQFAGADRRGICRADDRTRRAAFPAWNFSTKRRSRSRRRFQNTASFCAAKFPARNSGAN